MGETILLKTEESAANQSGDGKAVKFLTVCDGEKAKDGDTVIDIPSKIEGKLKCGLWAWSIDWEDSKQTIVYDPSLLKLKK